MIPKKIHYCWFGGNEKSDFVKKCIDTWKQKLPDYEIIEWNETNFDVNICDFTKKAYLNKKWAFVSDYARLYALYNHGGIYLDTDVEMLKDFSDEVLSNDMFMCFEDSSHLSTACIGASAKNEFLKKCMNHYDGIKYGDSDSLNTTPNSEIIFNFLFPNGSTNTDETTLIDGVKIYSSDYFSPKSYYDKKIKLTNNSFCIHHFDGTWKSGKDKVKDKVKILVRKIIGEKNYNKLKKRKMKKEA